MRFSTLFLATLIATIPQRLSKLLYSSFKKTLEAAAYTDDFSFSTFLSKSITDNPKVSYADALQTSVLLLSTPLQLFDNYLTRVESTLSLRRLYSYQSVKDAENINVNLKQVETLRHVLYDLKFRRFSKVGQETVGTVANLMGNLQRVEALFRNVSMDRIVKINSSEFIDEINLLFENSVSSLVGKGFKNGSTDKLKSFVYDSIEKSAKWSGIESKSLHVFLENWLDMVELLLFQHQLRTFLKKRNPETCDPLFFQHFVNSANELISSFVDLKSENAQKLVDSMESAR